MNGTCRRLLPAAILSAALAGGGCGMVQSEVFEPGFWAGGPFGDGDAAEWGLSALVKGDTAAAERHFDKALRADPRDVYALLGAALLFQDAGRTTKAREMYEAILALRPPDSVQAVVWSGTETRPIAAIARARLAAMETGDQATLWPEVAPAGAASAARPAPVSDRAEGVGGAGAGVVAAPTGGGGEVNVVARFEILRLLREQGLVTPDEYAVRRQANIGALLPLSAPPPAVGLDRPVPPAHEIAGRLQAIGRALEMRAMTVGQHAAERSMIVEALLPATPAVTAPPAAPPRDLIEAADRIRRLEQLRAAGVISGEEYATERAAVAQSLAPPPVPAAAAASPTAASAGPRRVGTPVVLGPARRASEAGAGAGEAAVHVASYRSRLEADRGWAELRRAHPALFDGLDAEITRADLGPDRGIYFRLNVGPLADPAAAAALCRELRLHRLYCAPVRPEVGESPS
ncbi:MAG: tetratricopeptide repeat protein [Rhodospirillales bacterium]